MGRDYRPWPKWVAIVAAICGILAVEVRVVGANEPAHEFLAALRERGYYDTVLDYLEQMRTSPIAPVSLKQTIDYERGTTLVQLASQQRDLLRREKLLDEAQQALAAFLESSASHRLAHAARNQLGNLLTVRGRMKVEQSKKNNQPALLSEAQRSFDEAYKIFTATQDELRSRLEQINQRRYDPKTQQEEIELREQMRSDYLQAQLLAAIVLEERAETVAKDSPEYKELLGKASAEYQNIEEKYRKWIAGLYAKLYRGRCLQKQGNFGEAVVLYRELLDESSATAEFRELKQLALGLALDGWLDPANNGAIEAVQRGTEWLGSLRPGERRSPDALRLQLKLARANKLMAEQLKAKDAQDRLANERLKAARDLALSVSRTPSDVQEEARALLADLRGVDALETAPKADPKSFAEAMKAGKDALDAMQNAAFLVEALPTRIEQEPDATMKAEAQQQLAEAQQRLTSAQNEAVEYFQKALALANRETPTDELNMARLYLAHLLLLRERYLDAAVLGSFVARRFPADAAAQEAARLSLAAHANLYAAAGEGSRQFEREQLESLAEYILAQWPDQAVAADAWSALLPMLTERGELDRIITGLERIPTDAPQRGDLELKVGRALWAAYREGMVQLRREQRDGEAGADQEARQAQLDGWKQKAQGILNAGLSRVRDSSNPVDLPTALAALYLAQVYVDTQDSTQALSILEDPRIGALELVRTQNAIAETPGFTEEAYKTALRAYLGMLASDDATTAMESAKGIMAELKQKMAGDAEGQQRLVAVYVTLARDLKSQMELATDAERRKLAQGFVSFLSEVGSESSDFQVLNWIAETFYNMAESFDDPQLPKAPAEAVPFYQQAVASYSKMLAEAAKDDKYLPQPQLATVLEVRTAVIRRRLGQFKEAMDTFKRILSQNNLMLNVQVEAARTFQVGASAPGFHELYHKAIMGDFMDTKAKPPGNIIWGWGKISKLTSGRKEFREVFLEARYNLALCRFEYAKHAKDAEQKKRQLGLAKQDVLFTYRLTPDLGDEPWKSKFDALTKEIQQALGSPPVGLAEFETSRQAAR